MRDYYARYQTIPSYQGIAELMGYGSKAAAFKLVRRCIEAELLRIGPGRRIVPGPKFFERPLLGEVRAGAPGAVDDAGYEGVQIDRFLVEKPSHTFFARVRGDSMVEAGIFDGDIAVLERGRHAKPGDFVLAFYRGEVTLKELALERGKPVLKPRNGRLAALRPEGNVDILGVFVGLARRHRPSGALGHREAENVARLEAAQAAADERAAADRREALAQERLAGQERHWLAEVERARAEALRFKARLENLETEAVGLRTELATANVAVAKSSAEAAALREALTRRAKSFRTPGRGLGRMKGLRGRAGRGSG